MAIKKNNGRGWLAAVIVLVILMIDQVIKIWVKTHMTLHEQIEILSWFKIVFIENNGMAYGMEIGSKLVLSLFRVVAIGVLGYYIFLQARKHARWGWQELPETLLTRHYTDLCSMQVPSTTRLTSCLSGLAMHRSSWVRWLTCSIFRLLPQRGQNGFP